MSSIEQRIANELGVQTKQVDAAIGLLDEGASVPFISRYRKEVTGGLDDSQMRTLEQRLAYLRDLDERRQVILKSVDEQGKLTLELRQQIQNADNKNRLEDLYLPFKPKRRTKAQIAREAGLEPLACALRDDSCLDPEQEAQAFINAAKSINDAQAALDGAKHILIEQFGEDADLLAKIRDYLQDKGHLQSRLVKGKEREGEKFRDYFDYSEAFNKVPSHRALAIFRGRNESILSVQIGLAYELEAGQKHPCELMVIKHFKLPLNQGAAAEAWLAEVVRQCWKQKLSKRLETDLLGQLKEQAETEAINVFGSNLKDLLLAAPAGSKATLGLDPGLRTGVKVAVVDSTGQVLDHCAIFPHPPQNKIEQAAAVVVKLVKQYRIELVAIGNGTASRETDKFVGDILKTHTDLGFKKVMVNEAGASVYSASELAAKEFPDLDVTIRGAISIARRLQDPLAELVKIEPKSIGVGQYQHDVNQAQLSRSLEATVEDCVNAVGVDVNTASAALLTRVSGLNSTLANNIVDYRNQNGAFANRKALKKVPRFGPKTFEQAAGFLRIVAGDNPLDASAVHPESYAIVEKIASQNQRSIVSLLGDSALLKSLNASDYVTQTIGLPTVNDILSELDKPGRDPRPEFKTADFKEGVETLKDLREGMVLEGVVSNVTNFGAFVDVGVHQDGLVHISAMSNKFIKDPHEIVKAGQLVKVKVMEIDVARKRIGLSMRLEDELQSQSAGQNRTSDKRLNKTQQRSAKKAAGKGDMQASKGTMAALFEQALHKNK